MPDNLQPSPEVPLSRVAPAWHTFALVAVLLLRLYALHGRMPQDTGLAHYALYAGAGLNGWMLFGVMMAGLYQRREFLRSTIEANAKGWGIELMRAVLVFATYVIASIAVLTALQHTHFHDSINHAAIEAVAPRSVGELAIWLLVSLTAGFCEEQVFRGYFLRQLRAWLTQHNASGAVASVVSVVLTSALFGCLHLYEGVGGAVMVAMVGVIFAVYALRFRNLRAVMLAHFLQDFLIGAMYFVKHVRGS